jgi:hypothetical protein
MVMKETIRRLLSLQKHGGSATSRHGFTPSGAFFPEISGYFPLELELSFPGHCAP